METSDEDARLREIGSRNLGWLSINRYGAVCLNSIKVFFADIDCVPSDRNPLKPVRKWDEGVALAAKAAAENALQLRVYRTFAGIRLIETSRTYSGKDKETLRLLDALGCDVAYVILTRKLDNFRVRLTPKPWRVKEGDAVDFSSGGAFDRYIKHPQYRVAAYVGTLGKADVVMPTEVEEIVAFHDDVCAVHREDLPLA